MTEKERREKGLPPSPARVALLETIQKDAEKHMAAVAVAMRPLTESLASESMQGLFRSLAQTMEPMTRIQESLKTLNEPFERMRGLAAHFQEEDRRAKELMLSIAAPREYVFPAVAYNPEPRVVRLARDQFDELVERVSATASPQNAQYMDLMYERTTKELYRYVYSKRFYSSFKDTEDNKRLLLLSKLLKNAKPVATRDLAAYLGCSQKQVQNLVQAVNAKLEHDLKLPQAFIIANRGSGYYINKFYCVYMTE